MDALEGKTDIMKVFHETLQANCQRNASPTQCVNREIERSQRSDGMEWVRHYLFGLGWNNCAIKYVTAWNFGGAIAEQRAELERRFKELFTIEKGECDDGTVKAAIFNVDIPADAPATRSSECRTVLRVSLDQPGHQLLHRRHRPGPPDDRQAGPRDGADRRRLNQLTLKTSGELALATVSADFVRKLMQATRVTVLVKEYDTSKPSVLNMQGAAQEIPSALERCFQPS